MICDFRLLKSIQKTVYFTVFFFIFLISSGTQGGEHVFQENFKTKRSSKYIVNYVLNCESESEHYFRSLKAVFFPSLMLNSDGSLISDYDKLLSNDQKTLIFRAKYNTNKTIRQIAQQMCNTLGFSNEPLIFELPLQIDRAYFVRLYFFEKINNSNSKYLYIKSSIEYYDAKAKLKSPISVWFGEAQCLYNNEINRSTVLDQGIKAILKHAFKNFKGKTSVHLLDI